MTSRVRHPIAPLCDGSRRFRAVSLVELLAVLALVAVLLVVGAFQFSRLGKAGGRLEAVMKMRTFGQAMLAFAADRDQQLPGPLWPGQVMLYDPQREGRLVRDLAGYLGVEQRAEPYVVSRLIPQATRRATPLVKPEDIRVYVVNSVLLVDGETLYPFGSLTAPLILETMRINRLLSLPPQERWMISEADQMHPDVATAPWKANTPAQPLHDGRRAVFAFDGSGGLTGKITP